MRNKTGKWWMALIAACCLTPAVFAYGGGNQGNQGNQGGRGGQGWNGGGQGGGQGWNGGGNGQGGNGGGQPMPEGGSTAAYLLGAGLTCMAAMYVRSRVVKPKQS
ncbi:MAG: hypothetical protein ABSD75_20640 [Terriglobales bacterium]|jgi:hypothetical protein